MNNNHKTLVSVIVPIYNTEKYISECIESLLCQTYKNLEIILVDDGSVDSSGEICDHYSINNPSINVIHTINQGRTKARITGVEHAKGSYITFVDADDYVAPTYVEQLLNSLLEQNIDVSCCLNYHVYGDHISYKTRTEKGRFDKKEIERILFNNFLFDERTGLSSIPHYLHCKLYRREDILQVLPLGLDLWIGEDTVAIFALFSMCDSIYVNEKPLYYYRQHQHQTTKRIDRDIWEANVDSFKTLGDIDKEHFLINQLPLFILSILRDWLKARYKESNSFAEFRSDMAFALNNETMEKYFLHKHIATSNKRHQILAFLSQHKMYYLYYMILKVHIAILRYRGLSS